MTCNKPGHETHEGICSTCYVNDPEIGIIEAAIAWKAARTGIIDWKRLADAEHALVRAVDKLS